MNFYEVLGVDPDADGSEVRRAYRDLARRYHPDVNDHPQATDQFMVLTRARDVLTDPEERSVYDRLGHDGYVDTRIDGDFPTPGVVTRSSDGTGAAGGVEGRASPGRASRRGDDEAGSPRVSSGDSEPARGTPDGTVADAGGDDGHTTDGAARDRRRRDDSSSGGDRGASHSVPPTPGSSRSSGQSKPRGPRRISEDRSAAWNSVSVGERLVGSLTAGVRWLGVVAAAGTYLFGLAGYLGAHRSGVDAFGRALTSSDPVAIAATLRYERYGVPSVTTYPDEVGLLAGGVPSDAVLLFAGVVLVPVAMALAVGDRGEPTTWRPGWLHVVGALGPVGAVVLSTVASRYPDAVPFATVPLLADVLLLVVVPGVAVASFLLNRLLVFLPSRRRDDPVGP